jgi:DinB superfamily
LESVCWGNSTVGSNPTLSAILSRFVSTHGPWEGEFRVSQVPTWFDRKFNFDFPVEQAPNLLVRLSGTPARLEEMLAGVAREVLVRKPDGKWSAQEHAGHLLDLEPLWMARVGDFLSAVEVLTAADLSNRRTHEAGHNAQPVAAILSGFRKARHALVDRARSLPAGAFARTILHPRLQQPMRLVDHLFFAAEHDDHHLAKIRELIAET